MSQLPDPTEQAGVERLATLQDLTARLARIVSSTEVASFVLDEGIARLGGSSGSLCLVVGGELEIIASAGYPTEVVEVFRRFPINAETPAGECVLTRSAVYCESIEALYERYPIFRDGPIVGDPSTAVLALEASDSTVLGTMVIGFTAPQRFGAAERDLLEAIAREASVALERARANEALIEARSHAEQARDQLAFLAEASASLAASLDAEETMAKLAVLAVPRISDGCVLYLVEQSGAIDKYELAPPLNDEGPSTSALSSPNLEDDVGVGAVIRTGKAFFAQELGGNPRDLAAGSLEQRELLGAFGAGAIFVAPLTVRGNRIGALAFVDAKGRSFSVAERLLGAELATRAAVAIDNARLFARELNIAETLQHALLPEIPKMDAIDVGARYLPGAEGVDVGGDWYDIVCPGEDRCVFVVGDVSGRGLRAATTMASLRYATRAYIAQGDSPDTVLARLGDLLSFESEHLFATVLIGEIEVSTRRLTLASAGHFAPLLVSRTEAYYLEVPVGTPVGIDADSRPISMSMTMPEDSSLIAFTDGLVERRGEHLDASLERLRSQAGGLRHEPVEAALDSLVSALIPGGVPDDVVILVFRWRS